DTLYIGGGTPSVLSPQTIEQIITHARKVFGCKPDVEITLEANPNNLNEEYMKQLADTSVNRLSIGIQSFSDDNLRLLGRVHTGKQAETCLELADKYRFSNLSVDLMYAYPQLTNEQWIKNLEQVKQVAHLSCYSLSLDTSSELYRQIQTKKYHMPDEDQTIEQYQLLTEFAKTNHFLHYEISNFCKPNRFSRHNSDCWKGEPYIGLGTAAHSFNDFARQWNIPNIHTYIQQMNTIDSPKGWHEKGLHTLFEQEIRTKTMQVNEYIMTSLRTMWGCDLQYIRDRFGAMFFDVLHHKIKTIRSEYYLIDNNKLILNENGYLLADSIASDLFFDEE
ncbi:MAG: coproporphyrinogen III oxidase family protein, partial [Bacteroidales bacterium]|nr:coproporphyrinogen III oxidase family protein [Bacteroidales bacterium]